MLLTQLSQYWVAESEYSFGWFVPVLSAYLFLIRWRSRPPAETPRPAIAKWVFWLAALALLPTWVIVQANPDWQVSTWLLAGEIVALTLSTIYLCGGASWLKQFAFSVCLIFTGVPWPNPVHTTVIDGLTKLSTASIVTILHLFQVHAIQHGNVIELSTGMVGVEEACSGIQSLQAALMLAFFLGGLFRTSVLRRIWLVLGGAAVAVGCNMARTVSLTAIASQQGIQYVDHWHDPLGYVFLTVCFLLVAGLARAISGPLPKSEQAATAAPTACPRGLLLGLGAWIMLTVVGTETWYRTHETTDTVHWSFIWPVSKPDFTEIPITKVESDFLLFNEGRGAQWTNEDGSHWVAYFFKWDRGPSWPRIAARYHRPENCFLAAGYEPCGDHGTITVQANGLSIPFHALDFENGGEKDFVFFCLWEEDLKSKGLPRNEDRWNQLTRIRSVMLGQRRLGQQTLEIVISGIDNQKQAESIFRREIVQLIDTGSTSLVADASKRQGS